MNTCFLCGDPADSDEHIIPKWLQSRYDLWNQRIRLPNNTTMPYRQLTIHCCKVCNNGVLSRLETKVKTGEATDQELWKWAAKIHFGLTRKDDFLAWDRRHPDYTIGQVLSRDDPLELDRHLVHSILDKFRTHPDPFGSVFRFEFNEESDFLFAHLINPAGIAICFENRGYVVFIKDTGTLRRQPSTEDLYLRHLSNTHPWKMMNFFANAWVHLYRYRTSFPVMMTANSIAIIAPPKLIEEREFTEEQYRDLWSRLTVNPDAKIVSNAEYDSTNGRLPSEDPSVG
ncbi:hypothetical protein DM81_2639 [Burkholderia multivorans]|uniref:hypothetical protein n=1 Tax=Burkholderia multivorans TaxID=87883 RepID=UPI00050E097E|nr:hypothetical protein [Burkholderia multivorans]KGB97898.1 hypothetical protein DM81_2639 [Burkholderia multivorans]